MNMIAAKAVAFEEASKEDFIEYSLQVVKNATIYCFTFVSQ